MSSSSSSMASNFLTISLLFSLIIIVFSSVANAATKSQSPALVFPLRKDKATRQFYITTQIGTPLTSIDLVIDLGGQLTWLNCEDYTSQSYRPVDCGSALCEKSRGVGCISCDSTPRPGCTNNTCGSFAYNPFENLLYSAGLGVDVVALRQTDGKGRNLPRFPFTCGYQVLLVKLARGTRGMAGLTRSVTSLPVQLASAMKLPPKFALCIPSAGVGKLYIGGHDKKDLSGSLMTTKLLINPNSTAPTYTVGDPSDEYFLDVRSIKIDGKVVPLNSSLLAFGQDGVGGTKISTVDRRTVLHSSIYRAVVGDFVKKAAARKMKRVEPVAPFGACFSSNSIGATRTGPAVPTIDLVLESQTKVWRIYGSNSMVKQLNGTLTCLAFIDGGTEPRTSIVLGVTQLENNFLEFDLASSTLGFTSSLLAHNTSCSL